MGRLHSWLLAAFVLAAAGCGGAGNSSVPDGSIADGDPAPGLSGLAPGWNVLEPGGDTVCSDGSAYRFFVRPGDPEKLLVYFQGGGACWFGANCDLHLDPSYKPRVARDEPERYRGIFDFEHPDNPFTAYTVVMAPYCSADVHLGNAVAEYQAPAREPWEVDGELRPAHEAHPVTIHHRGVVNAEAVLDWTYRHVPAPAEIFVTGSSAGAIPSPYYAWRIADHYPDARVAQLGDAAGGYRRAGTAGGSDDRLERWGTIDHLRQYPEFADVPAGELTYEDLYIAAAKRHPDILFAEYDAAEDAVQKRFLAMGGTETPSLLTALQANHADIRAEVDNFRAFIAGGDSHTVLARPEFYTFTAGGRRIRDWVADLAAFRPVDDVTCDPCDVPQLTDE